MVFMCDQCDASYPVRKSLSNHKRLKHGDAKQFNCEKCVYTSNKKENLQQHVRSVHEKVKEMCETCGKNFSKKSHLIRHVRRLHTKTQVTKRKASDTLEIPTKRIKMDDDIFNSDDDDQIFNEAYNFNNQKRNKIDTYQDYDDGWEKVEEAPGEISESEWEKLFGIVSEMEIEPENDNVIWQPWVVEPEKEKETPMDIDPIKKHTFKCQKCLFRSQSKEEFEEHIRTRHGIKCELCDQEFKEVKNLNKHMKNVHEEKSLKCNNCSYITNDVPSMQRHTESCNKRKSLQDVIEQDTNRAREEDQTDNQPPNEDIVSDDTETCFGGTLQTKIFKPRGSKDILKTLENYKSLCMRSAWYHLKKNNGIIFHTTLKITLFKI